MKDNISSVQFREGFERRVSDGRASAGSILLFHGLTGLPDEMEELASFLSEHGFNVLVPRLTGHGETIEIFKKTRAATWQQDAKDAFEQLKNSFPGPYFVGGLSFGALLALRLAAAYSREISGAVVMSVPLRLTSFIREYSLRLLSYLPDSILNSLGCRAKKERQDGIHAFRRNAYPVHSTAAVARLKQIQRMLMSELERIRCPMLILQDQFDHHVSADVPAMLRRRVASEAVEIEWIPHGQHELTIGQKHQEVYERIRQFLCRITAAGVP